MPAQHRAAIAAAHQGKTLKRLHLPLNPAILAPEGTRPCMR